MTALRHLVHLLRGHLVPPAVRGPVRQPAHRRRVPGRAGVVRRVLAGAGTRARARSPPRWPSCCCRSACSARSSGCCWTAGRAGRCSPGRTSSGSAWSGCSPLAVHADAARAGAVRAGPGLPVGQPVPARRAVRRPAARGRRGRPDHRQRADPDRRHARVPDRPRRSAPAPGSSGSGLGVDGDVGVLADRGRAVRRRRIARAAHPAGPARPGPRPGAPGRPRARCGTSSRGLVDGLRHLGERRAGGVRPDRDRRAPVLLRHLDGRR